MQIRPITPDDDAQIEQIIRDALTEFGANRPGFAWQDPELSSLSDAYRTASHAYWVVEDNGQVVGGCGIGEITPAVSDVCELQKMYLAPKARGQGAARLMMETALSFARDHYRWCYLETLATMTQAERLYRAAGFMALPRPLVTTEHGGCDRWYLLELRTD